jgi:LmbE family N-acetylglucosaminyl deacetylase
MIQLVPKKTQSSLHILCLGSHCDDIEIGCGGTMLRLIQDYPENIIVRWVVFSSNAERQQEAFRSAEVFLKDVQQKEVIVQDFEDSFFPYMGRDIKQYMRQLGREFSPDLIFTHYRQDLHQDHRLISELTWNTFRNHWILEYEIPKYDGDLGSPNVFVPLEASTCRSKIHCLVDSFTSQRDKKWFTEDTFLSILRLRGIECNAASGYAEAFYARKIVL